MKNHAEINDGVVLIFARSPCPGKVKTRLIPELGWEGALNLYLNLLTRLISMLDQSDLNIELHVLGDLEAPELKKLNKDYDIKILPQSGDDLGERMELAASNALIHYRYVALVGTDCPGMNQDILADTFKWLKQGADAVIAPAEDGGYVLLGLQNVDPCLFKGIAWGSEKVANQTRDCLNRLGWNYVEHPLMWDVDRPEDWHRLKSNPRYLDLIARVYGGT